MQSNGGITTARKAREQPIQTLLSGPVGGTIGGAALSRVSDRPNLLCVDMGGTSFDMSLIVDGSPSLSTETELQGLPVLMPLVDIHTIGAGGGSLAWLEAGGLRVGPQSAGAEPGPACYRRGGGDATVTDASLVLGYLNPGTFAGGISLDLGAAKAAIMRVADRIGLDLIGTAAGIHRIVNARMNDEVRRVTVQRGFDPRQFALLPLGGAGPVHGCAIAQDLAIGKVSIPDAPGVLSAFGLLVANIEHDQMETFATRADAVDLSAWQHAFERLEATGQNKMRADGVAPEEVEIRRQADMSYVGQSYELTIAFDSAAPDQIAAAVATFHARHEGLYGHSNPATPVEFVNLRTVHVHGPVERAAPRGSVASSAPPIPVAHREAYFDGAFASTPIYDRKSLGPGHVIVGPAIVEQADTTLVIYPRQRAHLQSDRSILVEIPHAQ
jgi:N-methylhydantoinase A